MRDSRTFARTDMVHHDHDPTMTLLRVDRRSTEASRGLERDPRLAVTSLPRAVVRRCSAPIHRCHAMLPSPSGPTRPQGSCCASTYVTQPLSASRHPSHSLWPKVALPLYVAFASDAGPHGHGSGGR